MKKITISLLALVLMFGLAGVVSAADLLPITVDTLGRPTLEGTVTTDGTSIIFDIRAVGQANDGDDTNPSKYYNQTNFDNEYFAIYANGELLKYNMYAGNTNPYWGPGWMDDNPLPGGVTFSQVEDGDDFVYAVSMSYAVLGVSEGDTFSVQIKARDFNDDYVQSYPGYEGFDGEYSQYRGLWITDTGVFNVTIPIPDTTAPLVEITAPPNGALLHGFEDIVGTVTDDVELSHYNLSLYPGTTNLSDGNTHSSDRIYAGWCSGTVNLSSNFSGDFCNDWDTTQYADGEYQIRLAARDAAENRDTSNAYTGNTSSVHVIGITIDNIPDDKDACKKGGWELYTSLDFKNQGACVSYLQSNEKAGKR